MGDYGFEGAGEFGGTDFPELPMENTPIVYTLNARLNDESMFGETRIDFDPTHKKIVVEGGTIDAVTFYEIVKRAWSEHVRLSIHGFPIVLVGKNTVIIEEVSWWSIRFVDCNFNGRIQKEKTFNATSFDVK